MPDDEKLLWRTEGGDANEESEDPAIIFEDKILPLLQKIQINPPATYNAIYSNQAVLDLFSSHLENIGRTAKKYNTVVSENKDIIDYTKIFAERSLSNNEKQGDPTPFIKFRDLARFISNTKYYDTIIDFRSGNSGFSGVDHWLAATGGFPPDIYFNKWWESQAFKKLFYDLDHHPYKDLIAGANNEPESYKTGNCCMTHMAMIIEAYYWNLDQFQNSDLVEDPDLKYKFVPWWFKHQSTSEVTYEVEDESGEVQTRTLDKNHKYEQDEINRYSWVKQPVDLLAIMNHQHPYADTAESTVTANGEFLLGCQD
jgi:hypothetical protein